MPNTGVSIPVAASMDMQYRLPPPQPMTYTPTILVSGILLLLALIAVIVVSRRARLKAKREARRDALRMVEKIILKRHGAPDDVDRMLFIFNTYPALNPAALVMLKDRFHDDLRPLLEQSFDKAYGEKMEKLFFPPPKDTRRALAAQAKDVTKLVEEQKAVLSGQTAAAIVDLMDATLKPGAVTKLSFEGMEGAYDCLIMGHGQNDINVTLPAHNDRLVASLRPGMRIEGTLESGPSLLAFSSTVIQAVAGSMPYCRIAPWKSAWEVRKRDAIRLPIALEIDFQHISTATSESINLSNLEKEIGTIRPGRLVDISLGGTGIETPSGAAFREGDMLRFSKSLVTGTPPATLLGAVVSVDEIDPARNEGSVQRLHVQFLVIDDVSQRILVRTIRQLQDMRDRDEWMQAQQLLQQMRRNKIQNIGSPSGGPMPRRDNPDSPYDQPYAKKSSTRTSAKKPAAGKSTRIRPKPPDEKPS